MFTQDGAIDKYKIRQEAVFILLSGLFIGSLAMLNILGISRLIDLSFDIFGAHVPFKVFVGVLPYPITFLCTDFISELYGKRRANMVVWAGLLLNIWVIFILWIGGILPPQPELDPVSGLPLISDPNRVFFEVRLLTFGATSGSMIAYLTAQFVDVHIFHFLRKLTKGKHLWLRNNGSTLTSQMVDSFAVILISYYTTSAVIINEGDTVVYTLTVLVLSNFGFKMTSALLDTLPFYIGVKHLSKFLNVDPMKEFEKPKYKEAK